jgi:hypothetical protein
VPVVHHQAHGSDGGASGRLGDPAGADAAVGAGLAEACPELVEGRLRPALRNHAALATRVLRIFIGSIERELCRSAAAPVSARIGAVSFLQRFGSSLNEHWHYHCCVSDGVFAAADGQALAFMPATVDAEMVARVQARVRRRSGGVLPRWRAERGRREGHGGVGSRWRLLRARLGRHRCGRPPGAGALAALLRAAMLGLRTADADG